MGLLRCWPGRHLFLLLHAQRALQAGHRLGCSAVAWAAGGHCSYPQWHVKQSRTNNICFYVGTKEWCSSAAFVLLEPLFTRVRCSYSCSTWTWFFLHVDNSDSVEKTQPEELLPLVGLGPQHSQLMQEQHQLHDLRHLMDT